MFFPDWATETVGLFPHPPSLLTKIYCTSNAEVQFLFYSYRTKRFETGLHRHSTVKRYETTNSRCFTNYYTY